MTALTRTLLWAVLLFWAGTCSAQQPAAADSAPIDHEMSGHPQQSSPPSIIDSLTDEERAWLREHPVIRVVQDPGWPPVEFADENGEPSGMSNDYLSLIEKRLGVTFERVRGLSWQESFALLKQRQADMTTCVAVTPERTECLEFTRPYMRTPIVIFTQTDVTYVASMSDLAGRKVAIVEGYALCDWIPRDYPDIQLVKVSTVSEGLTLLRQRKVFAFIDNLLVVSYYRTKTGIMNIKVAGETPYLNAQCMAVRKDWPMLADILQKAMDSITDMEHAGIYQKWVPIEYERGFDYGLLWKVLAVCAAVIALLLIWNRILFREITRRKETEAALSRSEYRLRRFYESGMIGIIYWNMDGVITDANDRFLDMVGYTRQDLEAGRINWNKMTPPEYRDLDERAVSQIKTAGIIGAIEKEYFRKDGSRVPVMLAGAATDEARFQGVSFVLDITARKQAEEAFRAEKGRAERYLDLVEVILVALDSEGRITLLNRKGCQLLGYTEEEILGRNWFEACLPPEEYVTVSEVFRGIMAGRIISLEYYENHIITRSGERRLIAWHNTILKDAEGRIIGTLGSGEDITERRHMEESLRISERQLSDAVELAQLAYWEYDSATATLMLNNRFYDLLGTTAGKEGGYLMPMDVFTQQFMLPDEAKTLLDEIERTAAGGSDQICQIDHKTMGRDGHTRYISTRFSVLRDPVGNVLKAYGTSQHITERKKAEEEVKSLAKFPSENPNPVLRFSTDGSLLYANEPAKMLLESWGLDKASSEWQKLIGEALAAGRPLADERELGRRTFSFVLAPVADAGYVNICGRDITERKQAEEALRASEQQLRAIFETAAIGMAQADPSTGRFLTGC